MPEATTHKNGEAFASKDKNWFSRQTHTAPPAGDVISTEDRDQSQFSGFVAG